MVGMATAADGAFLEKNGLVVMEIESAPVVGSWQSRTAIANYTGTEYYHNLVGTTSVGQDTLNYEFTVANAGDYQVQVRSRIAEGTSNTDANDSYIRLVDNTGTSVTPIPNDNVPTTTWYKFYQNTLNAWVWQASNKDNDPHALAWSLAAGSTYKLQISRRSQGHAIDKIVLWSRSTYNYGDNTGRSSSGATLDALPVSSRATSGTGIFDSGKDILIAHFDSKPDADDVMAQAALSSMLRHPDLNGVNYYAVLGAYGTQSATFIDSSSLMDLGFGTGRWTNAHTDWSGSVTRVVDKVKPILQAGGKVFVQEAGQSDFTADWIFRLINNEGIAESLIKTNVIVVQHSTWNESNTSPADLTYVRDKTDYRKIADRNEGGNGPPDSAVADTSYMIAAMSTNNPNAEARALWTLADDIIDASGFNASYSVIPGGGVDFSDCVENWYIFGIGTNADSVLTFWSRYVTDGGTNQPPTGDVISAINCGGGAFTAADGTSYAADQYFSGGSTYSTVDAIAGTEDDTLYQSERYGAFTYSVPVPNGTYDVVLQFAEIYATANGARVFDVSIEGAVAVNDLDIHAVAGHDAAHDVIVSGMAVSDGALTITTSVVADNPKLSAFTIVAAVPVTVNHSVPYSWLESQNSDWTNDFEAAVLEDPDGDGFTTWQEYWSGTDPQSSNSFLAIDAFRFDGSNIVLQWQHAAVGSGINPIAIQSTMDLVTGTWVNVGSKSPANGTNTWSGVVPQAQFYRLQAVEGS